MTSSRVANTDEGAIPPAAPRWGLWLIGAAVVLPALIAIVRVAGQRWYPAGDWAMIELRTRDAGTRHTPLVGPYSRYGWNHPGPLLFWYYAIPYRLSGGQSWSLLAAAALANAVAMAGMLTFAWRRGQAVLTAIVGLGLAILGAHLKVDFLWDPWNPWITVLPFGLLILSAWAASIGDRWGLPVAVLTAAFLVQSHIGFVLLAGGLLAWAAAAAWRNGTDRRTWTLAIGVGAATCVPMVLDQIFGQGNLGEVLRYFTSSDARPAGFRRALGVVARELGGRGAWFGEPEPVNPIGGAVRGDSAGRLLVPMVAFAGAGIAAWSCRATRAVRLQITVAVAAVMGFISVSRISDGVFGYLVRWWWMLAMLWWASIVWSVWSFVAHHIRVSARSELKITIGAAALILWIAVATAVAPNTTNAPAEEFGTAMRAVTPTTLANLPAKGGIYLQGTGPNVGWLTDALALQLDRSGHAVLLDDGQRFKAGEFRTIGDRTPAVRMTVVTGIVIEDAGNSALGREVVRWDPLPDEQRADRRRVTLELRDQLEQAGRPDLVKALDNGEGIWEATTLSGVDRTLVDARDGYRLVGDPVAVYLADWPGGAPEPADR
ncbi:MAG TPA: hypothetical protein VM282_23070 [Acidimicrobiales bacterium]|nr:hypothetical protein [Acidimicrobiales bacterium]